MALLVTKYDMRKYLAKQHLAVSCVSCGQDYNPAALAEAWQSGHRVWDRQQWVTLAQ